MISKRFFPCVVALVWATACNDPACVDGASASCACTDGSMGAQICAGGAFGACVCDGDPDAGSPDAGRDASVSDAPAPDATSVDAPSADAGASCDPLGTPGAQGCGVGERCTWIVLDGTTDAGAVGCVPDGPVFAGGACSWGTPGGTGFDDCHAGLVCISGRCASVCALDAAGSGCTAGSTCARYDGLFADGAEDPVAGACAADCDPILQTRTSDDAECGTGLGCYLLTNATETFAVCASAGVLSHGQDVDDDAPANVCIPGHSPRRRDGFSSGLQCGSLCNANEVTTSGGSEGGLDIPSSGIARDDCESAGASPPDSVTSGESCRYWWARESFAARGPLSNTVGWCFRHAVFQYDTNGDGTPDAPFPRCVTLTHGDVVPPIGAPPHDDATYFWCTASSGGDAAPLTDQPVLDRLGDWR